jgi:hypothetical protein
MATCQRQRKGFQLGGYGGVGDCGFVGCLVGCLVGWRGASEDKSLKNELDHPSLVRGKGNLAEGKSVDESDDEIANRPPCRVGHP